MRYGIRRPLAAAVGALAVAVPLAVTGAPPSAAATTVERVADINPGSQGSWPSYAVALGETVLFSAYDPVAGNELWRSDGTASGTTRVADIAPGAVHGAPVDLTRVGDRVYFNANNGSNGHQLWVTDGTQSGTRRVADLPRAHQLTPVGSTLFFISADRIWQTSAGGGTHAVTDPYKHPGPNRLTAAGGLLYFAQEFWYGERLYVTDGSHPGTHLEVDTGTIYTNPQMLGDLNGELYFAPGDGDELGSIWKTNGSQAGTSRVGFVRAGANAGIQWPAVLGNELFFSATDGVSGQELWAAGSAGVRRVTEVGPGSAGIVERMTAANGRLYFSGNDGTSGAEPWTSDGTAGGTRRIMDLRAGGYGSIPALHARFTGHGGKVFFGAYSDSDGVELFETDGTAAGTIRLTVNRLYGSNPQYLTVAGGRLFFAATQGYPTGDRELWAVTAPPPNRAPVVAIESVGTGNEGAAVAIAATASDPDGDPLTVQWSWTPRDDVDAGASCSFGDATAAATTITCTDDGSYNLSFTASDGVAAATTGGGLTVANAAPSVQLTAPLDGSAYELGTVVGSNTATADPGANDSVTCTLDWGDGAVDACGASHSFTAAGVYTVVATAIDDDGGRTSAEVEIIAYDPDARVAGRGSFDSPPGSFTADPSATAEARFMIAGKYQKGIPTGSSEVEIEALGFHFESTSYEWVVVNSGRARYEGLGTLNGVDRYRFMVSVVDGEKFASGGADRIRFQVTDSAGRTVYDSESGSPDSAVAATPLTAGGIRTHQR